MSGSALRDLRWARRWLLLWIVALKLTLIVCLLPLPALVEVPRGFDKLEHALGYFLLSAYAAMLFRPGRPLFGAMLGLIALGALIEILQAALPWRSAEWMDLVANALGIGIGALVAATPLSRLLQTLERWRQRAVQRGA